MWSAPSKCNFCCTDFGSSIALDQGSPRCCPRAPGRPQGPSRSPTGTGVAKGVMAFQISSISCRFVLWEVSSLTKYCCSLKGKISGPKKFWAGYATARGPVLKNNISRISVFTLRNILIVNTKIIKGKLSNIFVSEVCTKLQVLRINLHARSSSQLQEGWWSLPSGWCRPGVWGAVKYKGASKNLHLFKYPSFSATIFGYDTKVVTFSWPK